MILRIDKPSPACRQGMRHIIELGRVHTCSPPDTRVGFKITRKWGDCEAIVVAVGKDSKRRGFPTHAWWQVTKPSATQPFVA